MRRWAGIWIALTVAVGCSESTTPVLTIELIDPANGANPAAGIVSGTLTVAVEEGGDDRCASGGCSSDIEGGSFTLDVPIVSAEEPTRVQAFIDGGDDPLAGATPFFTHNEGLGAVVGQGSLVVRVAMLPEGQCTELAAPGDAVSGVPRLFVPRRDAGVAVRRNVALVAGGVGAEGATGRWDRWDQATSNFLGESVEIRPIGPADGLAITENLSLFVGDAGAVAFSRTDGPPEPSALTIHEGASHRSALHTLADTVAVVGGEDTDEVSWLPFERVNVIFHRLGEATSTRMLAPRTDPAVAPFEDGLLVVGGAGPDGPAAEILRPGQDGELAFDLDVEGSGGFLLPSPSQRAYLWIGRQLNDGTFPEDTVLITGCPDRCSASLDGPTWEDPRGASGAWTAAGAFWLVGGGDAPSARTDRVLWSGDEPRIERGPDLAHGRAGASVVENASGVIAVIGGLGPDSLRDDLELCLPSGGLDPF